MKMDFSSFRFNSIRKEILDQVLDSGTRHFARKWKPNMYLLKENFGEGASTGTVL